MNSSSLSAATFLGSASERVDAEQQSLALILNLLRHEEANTKLEIERISGLGRAIVADRVATLAEVKLADESEMGVATGGRAPRTIKFNHSAALFLLAHVDQSTIGMGLADLNGKLVFEHHEPSDSVADHQAILSRITALFDWAFEQHSNGRDVWGIGLSVEGPVEQSKDQPFASPSLHFLPSWDGSHFVEGLVAKYEAPVWVRNATQMTTLGELRAGGEQSALDMLFVDLGKEITAGIVCDGRLYRGAQGGAGGPQEARVGRVVAVAYQHVRKARVVDLRHAQMPGVKLTNAHFTAAFLNNANLSDARSRTCAPSILNRSMTKTASRGRCSSTIASASSKA